MLPADGLMISKKGRRFMVLPLRLLGERDIGRRIGVGTGVL